jgi:hypothetical protein
MKTLIAKYSLAEHFEQEIKSQTRHEYSVELAMAIT